MCRCWVFDSLNHIIQSFSSDLQCVLILITFQSHSSTIIGLLLYSGPYILGIRGPKPAGPGRSGLVRSNKDWNNLRNLRPPWTRTRLKARPSRTMIKYFEKLSDQGQRNFENLGPYQNVGPSQDPAVIGSLVILICEIFLSLKSNEFPYYE